MCAIFKISRSGYYAWRKCPERKRKKEDVMLMPIVTRVFENSRRTYGTRRIGTILEEMHFPIGRRRTRRLMDMQGLYPQTAKAFRHGTTTRSKNPKKTPDLVNRDFTASAPNRLWTGDITEVPTLDGVLYLAIIEDLFSRFIVGWSMMSRKVVMLVLVAFRMACARRTPIPDGCIFHTDKGSQYDCGEFRAALEESHFCQSMGSTGDCYDNAVTESAIGTIKSECLFEKDFDTRNRARSCIFEYIESFYNRERRHSSLGNLSPEEFERRWRGA